ncbi:hypothetical protein [Novosphingobium cyanobacteriorum]|uniref:Uncharacterized protein n=1 Tax=Novosphingobium cyanobacteriorum TaxID=3024215 RepID=A0ABT6CLS7_9SPHN|nr:hypothetical protein [Novosphingobium cyanobacteriorum]MDF8334188.1 hypothetical protein [Novosphingobium cyanobacteriorum]
MADERGEPLSQPSPLKGRGLSRQKLISLGLGIASAFAALSSGAVGEEIGGILTGRLDFLNALGAITLLVAGVSVLFERRAMARLLAVVGLLMILPMQIWRLFPGLWCRFGDCSVTYSHFDFGILPMVALGLSSLLSFVLSRGFAR